MQCEDCGRKTNDCMWNVNFTTRNLHYLGSMQFSPAAYDTFLKLWNSGEIKTEGHIIGFEHAVPICAKCLESPNEPVFDGYNE